MKSICGEYARALYALASEQDLVKPVMMDLQTLMSVLEDVPACLAFLTSPAIPMSKRLAFIRDSFGEKNGFHPAVTSFFELLTQRGRIGEIAEIKEEYGKLFHTCYEQVKKASVVSAYPLSEEQKLELTDLLSRNMNCRIELDCEVEPKILGGMYIEIDGMVIDGTLATRLAQAKGVMNQ